MNENERAITEELRRYLPLAEADVPAFLDRVAALTEGGDPWTVKPILLMVAELSSLVGVAGHVLSCLETVDVESYTDELLSVFPEFSAASPFWAEQEVKKLLWSDSDRAVLIERASRAPREVKDALTAVLNGIRTEKLAQAVAEVRRVLNQ